MDIKGVMEEALERGEKFKEQLFVELVNSDVINKLLQNETFLKSLGKVLNAKYEFQRSLKANLKTILKTLDLPNNSEVKSME
ncbi:MAG: hypothetical protein KDK66_05120, partial [Deltaproteobacteria bacterium]|nr:hypothetical protein [Deltaproteobacteria bacterium]